MTHAPDPAPANPAPPLATGVIDAVVIGRNEGARLITCLQALSGVRHVVYVDSGSVDGSQEAARARGAEVVGLDMSLPFTAARARNAGLAALGQQHDPARFVLFLDGDCELVAGFLDRARAGFAAHPRAVVVCGRRRERFPEASIWNRLCDREWNTPIGQALACGGDALMLREAVVAAGGYREDLIAGEEPELCLRLRRAGGEIWRIDAEMTLHDAAMTRVSQWWRRTRRAGHAFAEGARLHGAAPERHWRAETRRAVLWGLGVPLLSVLACLVLGWPGVLVMLLWPLQMLRLGWAWRHEGRAGIEAAVFTTLGKLPEALGVLGHWLDRLRGRKRGLIEYK